MRPFDRAVEHFRVAFAQREPEFVVRAPGRVNLLGAHVDYNDGLVLPVAIDRAAYLAVGRCPGARVSIAAPDLGESCAFRLTELGARTNVTGSPLPAWARYPAGVAWRLQQRRLSVAGMDAVLTSDVPIGAGLSSSAAVEVAFALAWQQLAGWTLPNMDLAQTCRCAENEYVGVNCGLMDQFASLYGRVGHALLLDCRSLEWEAIALPDHVTVVVADTGVRRALRTSAYNQRRAACEEAVRRLQSPLPHIRALRDVSPDDLRRHGHILPDEVRKRAQHVVGEIERTRRASDSLRQGDVDAMGRAMNASHRSSRDLYEVSIPELDAIARAARRLDGCYGARLTGAGFGGCAVALVDGAVADAFVRELSARYATATGRQARIYICRASDGAGPVD